MGLSANGEGGLSYVTKGKHNFLSVSFFPRRNVHTLFPTELCMRFDADIQLMNMNWGGMNGSNHEFGWRAKKEDGRARRDGERKGEKDFDAHLANGLQCDWTCVHRRRIICIIIYSINTVPCSLA